MTSFETGLASVGAGLCALGAAAGLYGHAALRPRSQIFGATLIAGRDPREMALTYDDGPNDTATLHLLDVLAHHGATAAFFMIGRFVRERPEIVRAVHAAGHIVGNHSDSHPWLSWERSARVREELYACNASLEDALGAPIRYFRPPHGARRPLVMRVARELGLEIVQWNAMGVDWEPVGEDAIVQNVNVEIRRNRRRGKGSNILLHDGWDQRMGADRRATLRATEMLLQQFSRHGDRVVSLDHWSTSAV